MLGQGEEDCRFLIWILQSNHGERKTGGLYWGMLVKVDEDWWAGEGWEAEDASNDSWVEGEEMRLYKQERVSGDEKSRHKACKWNGGGGRNVLTSLILNHTRC